MLSGLIVAEAFKQLQEGYGTPFAIVVTTVLIIVVLIVYWFIWLRPKPMEPPRPIEERRRGLIVIVSAGKPEESAALAAIKYHYRGEHDEHETPVLEYLWLIHSREYPQKPKDPIASSYDIARDLERIYEPLLKDVIRYEIRDPDDPAESFQCARAAFWWATHRYQLKPHEIVADITGGTKSMSIGLAYAGIPSARDVQFLKPRKYTDDGRAIASEGSDPLLIDVNFVEESLLLPEGAR